MAVLKKVPCKWASIQEPNTKFDPTYEIVAVLDDEQAAYFADKGVKVKEEEGENTVRFKLGQFGTKRDGSKFERNPPRCVDAAKEPFTDLIGNGSIVNIQYELKEWEAFGNTGVKPELKAVQVLEHVPYSGGVNDEFEEEGETKTVEPTQDSEEDEDDPF